MPDAEFHVKVVGVSFVPAYPGNLWMVHDMMSQEGSHAEPIKVVLIRNPQNKFDANAIEVHVPSLGEDGMVGHLMAPLAARIAPEMDSGVEWAGSVQAILVTPGQEHQPGMLVRLDRVGRRLT
jgi:hypothetical protein